MFFQLWCVVGVCLMLVRLKGNLKVTIDYEKWEVVAFRLEMKTLMKLQFSRDLVASFLHICHIFKNILEMVY